MKGLILMIHLKLSIIFCQPCQEQMEGLIGWLKTSYRILYSGLGFRDETEKLEFNIDISGHKKQSDKPNKTTKRLHLQEEITD